MLFAVLIAINTGALNNNKISPGSNDSTFTNSQRVRNNEKKTIFKNKLHDFISRLNSGKDILKTQNDYFSFISNCKYADYPLPDDYTTMLDSQVLPINYKYFVSTCFTGYLRNIGLGAKKIKGEHIIFSSAADSVNSYILFNKNGKLLPDFIKGLHPPANRIILSGTYTSQFALPTGLSVERGEIINPYLEKWDGLLLIDKHNIPHIFNINFLNVDFKQLNIKKSIGDYLLFLNYMKLNYITAIQSHLIIFNDSVCVDKYFSTVKARRRVLFETANGFIHIFDSFNDKYTIFEMAKYLRDNYNASSAINLDMGDYNYCKIFSKSNEVADYSNLRKDAVLSNLIVFDY